MRNSLFLIVVLLVASCSNYSKLLSNERSELARAATANLSAAQKLDVLMGSAIRVMEEALKPIDVRKGGDLVDQYYNQNQQSMKAIANDVSRDFKKMNLLEQGTFAVEVLTSDNSKKFIELYPKFKKKYKQVKTAARFMGYFSDEFGALGQLAKLLG